MNLLDRQCWVFDMDGTLSEPLHDFTAMRAMLGLPDNGEGILELLGEMPASESGPLLARLDQHERELAGRAEAADGAHELLEELVARRAGLGILTRNSLANAEVTLEAAGLLRFFERRFLVTRECVAVKPHPAGIRRLLAMWEAPPDAAAMVGDYLFDLQAGRAAGVLTVHVDRSARFPWSEYADVEVTSLRDLKGLLDDGP
ncbi:MAG: HAD family hydrolase [Candidatus Binatia bacterium]